jgi:hypothetical protein
MEGLDLKVFGNYFLKWVDLSALKSLEMFESDAAVNGNPVTESSRSRTPDRPPHQHVVNAVPNEKSAIEADIVFESLLVLQK